VVLALSRLTAQKGLDLLQAALPTLLEQGGQLVVQGTGDAALEHAFTQAAQDHPRSVATLIAYDEHRAHRLVAGADLIAVPSRFEPCGLTQLYGLRYGTLPLVRATGGLADTVVGLNSAPAAGLPANGFSFAEPTPAAFERALVHALNVWREPALRRTLQRRGMTQDLSWTPSAVKYRALYAELLPEAAGV
jgi:starch synthase